MTEANRIEFKQELTDDHDIERVLLCKGCFSIDL